MVSLSKWLGGGSSSSVASQQAAAGTRLTPARALRLLPSDTAATLASLFEAPRSVARAAVQLLPFGSRAALEGLGIVVKGQRSAEGGRAILELTPFGYEVIEVAANLQDADPESVVAMAAQWDAAIRR